VGCLQKRLLRVVFKHQSSMVGCLTDRWRTKDDLKELWFHHLYKLTTNEPCSKCLTSWHQIRKCLRHCLRLAYAHQSFAYATPLQGAPCLTWTQGFRTWLKSGFYDVTKILIHVYIAFEVKTTWNGHGTNKIKDMFWFQKTVWKFLDQWWTPNLKLPANHTSTLFLPAIPTSLDCNNLT